MKRYISIICLIAGFFAGSSLSALLTSNHKNPPVTNTAIYPADLKNTSVLVEAHFQEKVDSLMQSNTNLTRKATNSRSELQRAKQDNKVLLELVDTLLAHSSGITDTATKLVQCDSLNATVQELIVSTATKDSLYEDLTQTLQAQVSNKDTVISTQQEQYNCLKLSFDKSLAQQGVISGENFLLSKQLKTHKIKNKLLSAGVFILSGIAAYQFLHH